MITTISEALEFLHSASKRGGKKEGLTGISRLMDRLGHPERKYPTVHVAGTNGKGSTCRIIQSVLTESGLKTGLNISPYIETFNERIQIDGIPIDDDTLIVCTEKLRQVSDQLSAEGLPLPGEFELVTSLAFLVFAEKKVDCDVIEVGLGGRIDSTNIIHPDVCCIASIGKDHTHILGDTIEQIAAEKGGIILPGVPVVLGHQVHPEAVETIRGIALNHGAPFFYTDEDPLLDHVVFTQTGLTADASLPFRVKALRLNLAGRFQEYNLELALRALAVLKDRQWPVTEEGVRKGVLNASWPVRCEWIRSNVLLDGAHNQPAIQVLAEYLKEYAAGRPLTVLFAAMKDKHYSEEASILGKLARRIICTNAYVPRGEDPAVLAEAFMPYCDAETADTPETAVKQALRYAESENGIVVVTGSLYLAGAVRTILH